MLGKRLIGVITVRGGWAVQSFGYGRYLPLGRPEVLARNLDRWGADEILLSCIDRTSSGGGPDYRTIERVAAAGLTTPLVYGGGIARSQDGVAAVSAGADRVVVDAMLRDAPAEVDGLAERLGAQAVIAALPVSSGPQGLLHYDYRARNAAPFAPLMLDLLRSGAIAEALVINWRGEGGTGFDLDLIERFPDPKIPLIPFGGLSHADLLRSVLMREQVAAAGIGNALSYREHAIRLLKRELGDIALRPHSFNRWTAN